MAREKSVCEASFELYWKPHRQRHDYTFFPILFSYVISVWSSVDYWRNGPLLPGYRLRCTSSHSRRRFSRSTLSQYRRFCHSSCLWSKDFYVLGKGRDRPSRGPSLASCFKSAEASLSQHSCFQSCCCCLFAYPHLCSQVRSNNLVAVHQLFFLLRWIRFWLALKLNDARGHLDVATARSRCWHWRSGTTQHRSGAQFDAAKSIVVYEHQGGLEWFPTILASSVGWIP